MQKENSVIKNYILSSEKYQINEEKTHYKEISDLNKNFFILYMLFYANIDSCE